MMRSVPVASATRPASCARWFRRSDWRAEEQDRGPVPTPCCDGTDVRRRTTRMVIRQPFTSVVPPNPAPTPLSLPAIANTGRRELCLDLRRCDAWHRSHALLTVAPPRQSTSIEGVQACHLSITRRQQYATASLTAGERTGARVTGRRHPCKTAPRKTQCPEPPLDP